MEKKKNTPEQRNTVFVAVITSFITTFMGSALNLAVPNIESEFGVSAADVGWVITVYMLTCLDLNEAAAQVFVDEIEAAGGKTEVI